MKACIRRRLRAPRLEPLEARLVLSTLTVTNPIDGGPGSLRDLIVNRADAGDTIQFAPTLAGNTLSITQGAIPIGQSLTIDGSGETLDAGGLSRLFEVEGASSGLVTINDLTLAHGRSSATIGADYGYVGGAILQTGGIGLSLSSCTFVANTAQAPASPEGSGGSVAPSGGGAICDQGGTLTLNDCAFLGNSAIGGSNTADLQTGNGTGGAILAVDNASLIINGGRFETNTAHGGDAVNALSEFPSSFGGWGSGGAVFVIQSDATILGSAFRGNVAVGGQGLDGRLAQEAGQGGQATGGALTVAGTSSQGGTPAQLTITGCTFVDNAARAGTGGDADPGSPSSLEGGADGGRAAGGAVMTFYGVDVVIAQTSFSNSAAIGGAAGMNTAATSSNAAGWGGVSSGGAVYLEGPHSVAMNQVDIESSTAAGGQGSGAPTASGNAGQGGWVYGGGLYIINNRSSSAPSSLAGQAPTSIRAWPTATAGPTAEVFVLPVSLIDTTLRGNAAVGGEPGVGQTSDVHAGGGAQGGAADLVSLIDLQAIRTNWIDNRALGGSRTLASGGGLAIAFGGDVSHSTIVGGIFSGNLVRGGRDASGVYQEAMGGAILNNAPNMILDGVSFSRNTAQGGDDTGSGLAGYAQGGAVAILGQDPSLDVRGCTFQGNAAVGGSRTVRSGLSSSGGYAEGGAIYISNGSLRASQSLFTSNSAAGSPGRDASGGAIYLNHVDSPQGYHYLTTASLTGNRFVANTAAASRGGNAHGGAIANYGNVFDDQGSSFARNIATVSSGGRAYGGALYNEQPTTPVASMSITLRDTVVRSNRATAAGRPRVRGKAYGGGIAFVGNPPASLIRVLVRFNRASTAGHNIWGKTSPIS